MTAAARSMMAALLECAGEIEAATDSARRAGPGRAGEELDALSDDRVMQCLEVPYRLGIADSFLERYDEGARHLRRGIALAVASGNGQFIVPTRTFLAYCLFQSGRIDAAVRVAGEAAETGRLLRVPAGLAWALSVGALTWSIVDTRHALKVGEEALAAALEVDDNIIRDATHAHFAWVCANAGEHERCIEHMHVAGAPGFPRFEPGRRCMFAEALVRSYLAVGQPDAAHEWASRGEALAAGLGLRVAAATVMRARAMVLLADGDAGRAAELALRARAEAARAGARIEAGRSGITAGHALTAAGERERAVAELRAASAEMSRCGARHLEHEATYQLRRLGAAAPAAVPRRRGDAGTAELSKREREIAALVAAGNSNPQIGRALFLSPKTIEAHMRRIFEKLGVSSRAEVAAMTAREEGPARPAV